MVLLTTSLGTLILITGTFWRTLAEGDSSVAVPSPTTLDYSYLLSSNVTLKDEIVESSQSGIYLNSTNTNSNDTFENVTDYPMGNECFLFWNRNTYITVISFCIIFCLSIIGNSIVIVVILKQRSMRSITNLFLLNLAIADLLLSVICIPPTLHFKLCYCWQLGVFLCKMVAYLQPVSVTASAYTLAVIALERYNAICRPLKSRAWQTRSLAYKMIALVWLIAFLSNIYLLFMYDVIEPQPKEYPGRLVCDQYQQSKAFSFYYQVYMTVIFLIIPLSLMVILYGFVIRSLKASLRVDMSSIERKYQENSDDIHEIDDNLLDALKGVRRSSTFAQFRRKTLSSYIGKRILRPNSLKASQHSNKSRSSTINGLPSTGLRSTHSVKAIVAKQRLIRMLVVIVVIFFCCWTPNIIYWLILAGIDYFWSIQKYNPFLHSVLLILCYLSCCTNPITYCFLNKKFRNALLLTFGCQKAKPLYLPMTYMQNVSPGVTQLSPNPNSDDAGNRTPLNGFCTDGSAQKSVPNSKI